MRDQMERYFCVLALIYEVGVQMSTRLELPLPPLLAARDERIRAQWLATINLGITHPIMFNGTFNGL